MDDNSDTFRRIREAEDSGDHETARELLDGLAISYTPNSGIEVANEVMDYDFDFPPSWYQCKSKTHTQIAEQMLDACGALDFLFERGWDYVELISDAFWSAIPPEEGGKAETLIKSKLSSEIGISVENIHCCVVLTLFINAINKLETNEEEAFVDFCQASAIAGETAASRDWLEFISIIDEADKQTRSKRDSLAESLVRGGYKGGKQAARNRIHIRKRLKYKIRTTIENQKLWDNWSQTSKSITDILWEQIRASRENSNDWNEISSNDLLLGKIGRQTVYDAVMETDPR